METNVFGQPDNMQPENVQKEGNNPTLIVILLILILGGAAVLGFLLYRQSQEPAPVVDEVVESVELPAEVTIPEVINESEPTEIVEDTGVPINIIENDSTLNAPVE
jgi:cell division protein YceG involved in septum cleavage